MRNLLRACSGLVSVACLGLVCVSSASAQQRSLPPTTPAQTRPAEANRTPLASDPDVQKADIAIIADIKAESLIFEVVPNPTVEFPGSHKLNTVWEAFRDNLPTPVQPGVTYRNIGIRLKITSVFADIDRIVSEALGETPVTEDAKPEERSPRSQNQPKPPSQSGSAPPPRER